MLVRLGGFPGPSGAHALGPVDDEAPVRGHGMGHLQSVPVPDGTHLLRVGVVGKIHGFGFDFRVDRWVCVCVCVCFGRGGRTA